MASQLQLQSKLKHNNSHPLHHHLEPASAESAESTPSSGQPSTPVPPSTSASASASSANNPSASNSSSTSTSNAPTNSTSSSAPTFEFTRRKRWADILINEVPENIILVLSPTGVIWFSGVAMVELLGWTIEEVLDKDFLCFVNDSDQTIFRNCFIESLATGELFTYVRLRCKKDMIVNPDNSRTFKELLFEIKGYPHYVADDPRCKCFFAMARPYPTRSAAFLNTFLELKIENERLKLQQEHVHRSIASIPSSLLTPSLALPALSAVGFPGFPQTFFNATQDGSLSGSVSIGVGVGGDAKTGVGGGGVGVVGSSSAAGPGAGTVAYGILTATNAFGFTGTMGYEDENEVTSIVAGSGSGSGSGTGSGQKRKTSRNFPEERYVCVSCGRTDSPEWRKGPAGPKTLCNACGLRYAKKARKMPVEDRDRDLASATSAASNPSSNGNGGGSGPGVQNGNSQSQGLYGNTSRNGSGVSIAGVGTGAGGYGLPASSTYAGFQQS